MKKVITVWRFDKKLIKSKEKEFKSDVFSLVVREDFNLTILEDTIKTLPKEIVKYMKAYLIEIEEK